MITNKWTRNVILVLFSAFLVSVAMPTYSFAQESQGTFEFHNVNDSTLQVKLNHASSKVDEHGTVTVTDLITGKSEQLPTTTKDKNGNDVKLVYAQHDNGFLVKVQLADASPSLQTKSAAITTSSVGKCVLGTGGGAVTGAGTLGLAGAAVGTVTLPVVGTVSGGLVGSITGAVGGGLTGAAASCF